jgi:hypothetical protein
VSDPDAAKDMAALLAPKKGTRGGCRHPASRLWCWQAHDLAHGLVWCVACCDCGAVLRGEATLASEQEGEGGE